MWNNCACAVGKHGLRGQGDGCLSARHLLWRPHTDTTEVYVAFPEIPLCASAGTRNKDPHELMPPSGPEEFVQGVRLHVTWAHAETCLSQNPS